MKHLPFLAVVLLAVITLTACHVGQSNHASQASQSAQPNRPIPTTPDKAWFVQGNTYYAGNQTVRIKNAEVHASVSGTKVLVVFVTVRNNSQKSQTPANLLETVQAKQKYGSSNLYLGLGMIGMDANGNIPFQKAIDNLNTPLMPGKTTHTVMKWTLKSERPVTLEFTAANGANIGKKVFNVTSLPSR